MVSPESHYNNKFKYYDFQKLWRVFPIKRSVKENMKIVIFKLFPFYFKNWAIYQNWKYATVFFSRPLHIWQKEFWKRLLKNEYDIKINPSQKHALSLNNVNSTAIIIHAFYIDIFNEIIQKLSLSELKDFTLYITAPDNLIKKIENSLRDVSFGYSVLVVENLGRDILPFLKILPLVIDNGHDLILKLHTKNYNHLNRKDHWRDDLFEKLIGIEKMTEMLKVFRENSSIGMIGPIGNILPMRLYYGANGERVHRYSKMMGATDNQLSDLNFVAGSMFYVRTQAILPLLKLQLTDEDFEPEAGQTDGTMAHVVERMFSVSTILSGLQMADTNFNPSKPTLTVSKNHRFTL